MEYKNYGKSKLFNLKIVYQSESTQLLDNLCLVIHLCTVYTRFIVYLAGDNSGALFRPLEDVVFRKT
jgi:hypothetical protein